MRARFVIPFVLLIFLSGSVRAEKLVFGSFRSSENAHNWAQKLSTLFATDIEVTSTGPADRLWFRVHTGELDTRTKLALQRRADAGGISYWTLHEHSPQDLAGSRVTRPQRLTPPAGQVAPAAQQETPAEAAPVFEEQVPRGEPEAPMAERATPESQDRSSHDIEWDLGLQSRSFAETGVQGQDQFEGSVSVELEYYRGWQDDKHSVTFSPFLRVDSADSRRTHADMRELFYSRVGENWDLHVGARRVFWGVTEFHHLVDIINQTDLIENIDGEDKLGQPMVQLTLVRDWGILDFYLMSGFRERTFPGSDGRIRHPVRIDSDADYASSDEEMQIDGAIRWSHHIGPVEFGLHHFSGTSRDPELRFVGDPGDLRLRPFYHVIDQTGLDAQAFYGDWAFKIEGFTRSGLSDRYAAANVGFERTLVGFLGTRADVGLVVEYMFDERGDEAFNTLFENDIAIGTRFQFNDFADTEALLGVIFDADTDEYIVSLEASRRLTDSWALNLEGRVFAGGRGLRRNTPLGMLVDPDYKSAWLQRDDYLQLEIKKFF